MEKVILAGVVAVLLAVAGVAYLYLQPTGASTLVFAGQRLTVDVAKTSTQQQQGLSGRPSMSEDHGMLFVFSQASKWGFWMKGMEFPLDIIWFDANKSVIYYVQDLPPCTPVDCPSYYPPSNALYVLEVNAGFVSLHNVTLGEAFSFGT
jgi:uncharacterized membrane protein (UPF0127 family)